MFYISHLILTTFWDRTLRRSWDWERWWLAQSCITSKWQSRDLSLGLEIQNLFFPLDHAVLWLCLSLQGLSGKKRRRERVCSLFTLSPLSLLVKSLDSNCKLLFSFCCVPGTVLGAGVPIHWRAAPSGDPSLWRGIRRASWAIELHTSVCWDVEDAWGGLIELRSKCLKEVTKKAGSIVRGRKDKALSFQILKLHYLLSVEPVKFSRKQLLWLFKNLI